jgi:hypothetical protein
VNTIIYHNIYRMLKVKQNELQQERCSSSQCLKCVANENGRRCKYGFNSKLEPFKLLIGNSGLNNTQRKEVSLGLTHILLQYTILIHVLTC